MPEQQATQQLQPLIKYLKVKSDILTRTTTFCAEKTS
jgi:hypothetical protein